MNLVLYGEYAVGFTALIVLVIHLICIIWEEIKVAIERIRGQKELENMEL